MINSYIYVTFRKFQKYFGGDFIYQRRGVLANINIKWGPLIGRYMRSRRGLQAPPPPYCVATVLMLRLCPVVLDTDWFWMVESENKHIYPHIF